MQDSPNLSGAVLARARQALRLAPRQVQAAQRVAGPRTEDALAEIAEAIGGHLGALAGAIDADRAETEESGAAERERREWIPVYRAA